MSETGLRIGGNWTLITFTSIVANDVENAFVPEHRTHRLVDGFLRKSPGNTLNTAPLYKLYTIPNTTPPKPQR